MLSLQEIIEIVLICTEKTPYQQVASIFKKWHPESNIQFSTVSRLMAKLSSMFVDECGQTNIANIIWSVIRRENFIKFYRKIGLRLNLYSWIPLK